MPAAGVTPFTVNGFSMRPFSNRNMAGILASCDAVRERVLVLIQLKGGNDGLNTLIPLTDYDRYMELRPTIGIAENQYIELDSTLPGDARVALHPAMTGIKALYDKGWASVVQAVGYDSMNQSHFKGTDLWLSGGDSTFAAARCKPFTPMWKVCPHPTCPIRSVSRWATRILPWVFTPKRSTRMSST